MFKPLILSILAAVSPTLASAESYASSIADGAPWTTTAPNGGKMRLTLNPDGTGRMSMGIMGRDITWTEKDDTICLGGMPGGASRCISFSPSADGFTGTGPDGTTLLLRR